MLGFERAPNDWSPYKNPDSHDGCVATSKVIYCSRSIFFAQPPKYYVWLHSSPDGTQHVFQRVEEVRGADLTHVCGDFLYLLSDRPVPSGTLS